MNDQLFADSAGDFLLDEQLMDACYCGDLEEVKQLIKGGANISSCYGNAFIVALGNDHYEIINYLNLVVKMRELKV